MEKSNVPSEASREIVFPAKCVWHQKTRGKCAGKIDAKTVFAGRTFGKSTCFDRYLAQFK
jgi:hypothetical protein